MHASNMCNCPIRMEMGVKVCPKASCDVGKTYPIGIPILVPIAQNPLHPHPIGCAQYVLRQAFVTEITLTIAARACTMAPSFGCHSICDINRRVSNECQL